MMYSSCTKWPLRQQRPEQQPLPPDPRKAARPALRRRCDVEKRTDGSAFWGPTVREKQPPAAGAAPPALPWCSVQHADFGGQNVSEAEHRANEQRRRDRASAMRTESIRHGDDPPTLLTEAADNMRRFPRDLYVGRVMYPPGGKHSKTKSEFFISPAEVAQWRKGLATMSRRQFRHHRPATGGARAPGAGAGEEVGMAEIQKDMLCSHFAVGDGCPPSEWSSQTAVQFSPRRGLFSKPVRAECRWESAVPLRDANLPERRADLLSTAAASFPAAPHRLASAARKAAAEAAAHPQSARGRPYCDAELLAAAPAVDQLARPLQRILRPHSAAAASALSPRAIGARVHGSHSWHLGYGDDAQDPGKYMTQQRIAFRRIQFVSGADEAQAARARRESDAQERRNSRDRIVHNSDVPL